MRSKMIRLLAGVAAVVLVAPLMACGMLEEPTALRLMSPGSTVWIDGWNQGAKVGDRSLVEQKPSGMWVVPTEAEYRTSKQGEFTVEITLDPQRGFVIVNMNGVLAGTDSDDCLADGETYAFPANAAVVEQLKKFESTGKPEKADNDDCLLTGDDV